MTFVSYAQNFEDVILARAFKDVENGHYIDVGANDPTIDSVTRAFYDRGWRGVNIEPVEEWYDRLVADRPGDVNLAVAVGAERGTFDFYDVPGTGLSTMVQEIAELHERQDDRKVVKRKVEVVPLAELCAAHAQEEIHFLKIDVEGAEQEVLRGCDFAKYRPWILVIESTLPNTQNETRSQWEEILLAADYQAVHFDGLNRFYLANEHADLAPHFTLPPNFFDNFILHSEHYYSSHARQAAESAAHEQALVTAERERSLEHTYTTKIDEMRDEIARVDAAIAERCESDVVFQQRLTEQAAAEAASRESLLERMDKIQLDAEHSRISLVKQHEGMQRQLDEVHEQGSSLALENVKLTKLLEASERQTRRALQLSIKSARKVADIQSRMKNMDDAAVEQGRAVGERERQAAQEMRGTLEVQANVLAESEAKLRQSVREAEQMSQELRKVQLEVSELNQHSHHWHSVAVAANAELASVHKSLSWRLTTPLRKVNAPFVRRKRAAQQIAKKAVVAAPEEAHAENLIVADGAPGAPNSSAPGSVGSSRAARVRRRLTKAIASDN